ncbi:MAG: sarcosine oxidase [Proteobacteria bacterium]|nr:sarcosine oxidase [Pseudomonadota bacterium]
MDLGANFDEVAGAACAMNCGNGLEAETKRARSLAVCDLSALPRAGFKGREAQSWPAAQGLVISPDNNFSVIQDDGALVARLADSEVLILSDLACRSGLCARLAEAWSPDPDPGVYPVPRRDTNCWYMISGGHADALFAKLCAVDLRPHKFPLGAIAQTSLARLNGIVIRADLGDVLAYHLLTDSAAAGYMWMCLLDAMDEWGGAPVGLAALRGLGS